jgi:hypothetical protein
MHQGQTYDGASEHLIILWGTVSLAVPTRMVTIPNHVVGLFIVIQGEFYPVTLIQFAIQLDKIGPSLQPIWPSHSNWLTRPTFPSAMPVATSSASCPSQKAQFVFNSHNMRNPFLEARDDTGWVSTRSWL